MRDNKANVIRLRELVVRLSDNLGDLVNKEESMPDELRFSLALLDE